MVEFLSMNIHEKDIIYNGKVKKGRKGMGIIRLKDRMPCSKVSAIFPIRQKRTGSLHRIEIDDIVKLEIDPDSEDIEMVFARKYAGRKCIITSNESMIRLNRREIIYEDEVKNTYNGQGIIRLKDMYLGHRAYAIFPHAHEDGGDSETIAVDEILNKGIHPENHTTRILLGKKYVGRKCIVVLQEG